MRKYLILFSLSGDTVGRFIQTPSDRAEVVRKLAEVIDGTLQRHHTQRNLLAPTGVSSVRWSLRRFRSFSIP